MIDDFKNNDFNELISRYPSSQTITWQSKRRTARIFTPFLSFLDAVIQFWEVAYTEEKKPTSDTTLLCIKDQMKESSKTGLCAMIPRSLSQEMHLLKNVILYSIRETSGLFVIFKSLYMS